MITWNVIQTLAIPVLTALYSAYETRRSTTAQVNACKESMKASDAKRRANEELERQYREGNISQRSVNIPSNAFNAGPEFTLLFTSTAVVGTVLLAKAGQELRKIGLHLGEIRDELRNHTTAMVQGWQTQGFGAFIYQFLKTEIEENGGESSVGSHAFYVYNPTTAADVVFKQKVQENPLPASFGGFSSDLEAIFRLMWANRTRLRETLGRKEADAVVFHLLVPAKGQMAVIDRMEIDDSIGRLIIKGHRDEGDCYVWFNFINLSGQVTLCDVGLLNIDKTRGEKIESAAGALGLTGWAAYLGAIASISVFPPAVPVFAAGWASCMTATMGLVIYGDVTKGSLLNSRKLGPPTV